MYHVMYQEFHISLVTKQHELTDPRKTQTGDDIGKVSLAKLLLLAVRYITECFDKARWVLL